MTNEEKLKLVDELIECYATLQRIESDINEYLAQQNRYKSGIKTKIDIILTELKKASDETKTHTPPHQS